MSFRLASFIGVPISVALLHLSAPAHSTDLAEVYKLAVENDHEFKAASASYHANAEAKNLARSALLPSINGRANWDDSEIESNNPLLAASSGITENTTKGYGLALSQTLFDLAAWNSFKAGAASSDAAEANFHSSQQALIIRSSQAYFDALLAASNLQTSQAQEDALHHQLKQTKQRFDVGLSAITEVHEAQAAFDSSVAERLLAEGRLGIAFEAIEVITGRAFDEIASLKPSFSATAPQPNGREEWVARALESNYQLIAAKLNADAAEYTAKSAKSGHYPTLTLNGQYSHRELDGNVSPTRPTGIEETDTRQIGVTLNVPIYNGGSVSAKRRQANHQAIEARENYLKLRRDVVQTARTQHLNVLTGVSTVNARAQAIVSRESALEATQAGYRVGTRDLVDVLNAQQSLFQARRNYNTALFDYILSSLNLKAAAGQLNEKDIITLNAWLDKQSPVKRYLN